LLRNDSTFSDAERLTTAGCLSALILGRIRGRNLPEAMDGEHGHVCSMRRLAVEQHHISVGPAGNRWNLLAAS